MRKRCTLAYDSQLDTFAEDIPMPGFKMEPVVVEGLPEVQESVDLAVDDVCGHVKYLPRIKFMHTNIAHKSNCFARTSFETPLNSGSSGRGMGWARLLNMRGRVDEDAGRREVDGGLFLHHRILPGQKQNLMLRSARLGRVSKHVWVDLKTRHPLPSPGLLGPKG